MFKHLVLSCVLLGLCGCATHQEVPWTEAVYEKGEIYIFDGTEVLKTASLFTAHGTFEKITFPVKREFKVYRHSDRKVIFNKVSEKVHGFGFVLYEYFADSNALIVSYEDWRPRIKNLTTGRSFRLKGLLANLYQPQCRYALAQHFEPTRYYIYDKFTGKGSRLTPKTLEFIGDEWHTKLFVSRDGTMLSKVTPISGSKTFQVSVWDLTREKLVAESPLIPITEAPVEILHCHQLGESVAVVYEGPSDPKRGVPHVVKEVLVNPTDFEVKVLDSSDEAEVRMRNFVEDDLDTATMSYWIGSRLRLKRFNLRTGAILHDETVELPVHPRE
jgi:hypothetical protein